jgi:PilZ domain
MERELRRSPRIPFVAAAEITELQTETRLPARTGDLSRHGCYVDMVNPLPVGTPVRVHITHGQRSFYANAGVVYSQTPLGMGLAFQPVESKHEAVLESWLSEAVSG